MCDQIAFGTHHLDAVVAGFAGELGTADIVANGAFDALSSEPLGLVSIEALSHYKKVVAYKDTGTAELISGISGCGVYNDYSVEAVIKCISDSFSHDLDIVAVDEIVKRFSVEEFSKRISVEIDNN